jgi:hypothetical protein
MQQCNGWAHPVLEDRGVLAALFGVEPPAIAPLEIERIAAILARAFDDDNGSLGLSRSRALSDALALSFDGVYRRGVADCRLGSQANLKPQ